MKLTHGSFNWYELMTGDIDAAAAYYRDVLGLTSQDSGMPGMRYELLTHGTDMTAGIMAMPAEAKATGAPHAWVGYIGVDDADATVRLAVDLGGRVVKPVDQIPGVGRFAVLADPHGAVFCILQPDSTETPEIEPMSKGRVGWHELMCDDVAAALAFYQQLFGWTKQAAIDMGPAGIYQLFAHNGRDIGGMMKRMAQMPVCAWNYYFFVEALDAAVSRLTSGGGTVVNGPMEVPGGAWIVVAVDPQGAHFSLIAPRR